MNIQTLCTVRPRQILEVEGKSYTGFNTNNSEVVHEYDGFCIKVTQIGFCDARKNVVYNLERQALAQVDDGLKDNTLL